MLKIRNVLIVLGMLFCSVASADVQVSIGINLPIYPQLIVVPGYPVYYAPRLQVNYFFYDGMYWVYQDDYWYSSSWYNGPWWLVGPEVVPLFVLRIPVYYYRQPPTYFIGWRSDAPPRWGDHWGRDWEQRRSGWDRWDRGAAQAPAPLPVYQRQYSGDRYPRQVEQQHDLQQQKYRYQPRDPVVRQQYQEQARQRVPDQQGRGQQNGQGASEDGGYRKQDIQRSMPRQQSTQSQQNSPANPRSQSPQRDDQDVQRSAPASPQQGHQETQDHRQPSQAEQRGQAAQQAPAQQEKHQLEKQQGKDTPRDINRGQEKNQQHNQVSNE